MPSEAFLTDTLNLGVDDIPAEYRTSFLLATLFRVKPGGSGQMRMIVSLSAHSLRPFWATSVLML